MLCTAPEPAVFDAPGAPLEAVPEPDPEPEPEPEPEPDPDGTVPLIESLVRVSEKDERGLTLTPEQHGFPSSSLGPRAWSYLRHVQYTLDL